MSSLRNLQRYDTSDELGSSRRIQPARAAQASFLGSSSGWHARQRPWSQHLRDASCVLRSVSHRRANVFIGPIGRDFGKRKESHLYSLWGGKPSVAKMRHRDTTINAHTRERYYRKAESLLAISIPDAPSEQTDPSTSDALYEAYSNLLLERTRDRKKFPLVFQELTNYGFRRNLWGMKPIGLTLTLLCAAGQLVSVIHSLLVHRTPSAFTISCLLVTSFLLASWLFIINPGWVKLAGDAYAERLLASAEMLQAPVAPVPAEKRNPRPRRAKSVS